jgi:hypothetical protein
MGDYKPKAISGERICLLEDQADFTLRGLKVDCQGIRPC